MAALGNKYALGNNGGRPRHYTDPEVLAQTIDDYFEWCKGEYEESTEVDESGIKKKIYSRESEPHTVTGLCLYLGFSNRGSLDDYEKLPEFSHIIKYARMRVERAYESRLHAQAPTGAIFALKNMGWTDKHEVENSGNLGLQWNEVKTYDPEKKSIDDSK